MSVQPIPQEPKARRKFTLHQKLQILKEWEAMKRALSAESEYGILRMTFFMIIVFHNITESSYGRPNNLLWFLFLLVVLHIPEISRGNNELKECNSVAYTTHSTDSFSTNNSV